MYLKLQPYWIGLCGSLLNCIWGCLNGSYTLLYQVLFLGAPLHPSLCLRSWLIHNLHVVTLLYHLVCVCVCIHFIFQYGVSSLRSRICLYLNHQHGARLEHAVKSVWNEQVNNEWKTALSKTLSVNMECQKIWVRLLCNLKSPKLKA